MGSIKKEITLKETNTLFVLVGESADNSKFLNKCEIKNDLIVVNTDNKKMTNYSIGTQKVNKQMNYDELKTKFKSDSIDLMFYGALRSEFYCIQVATGMQDYLQHYNFVQIFSSKLIPISKVNVFEMKKFKSISVESRFKSISNHNDNEKMTFFALDKMGTLNYSSVSLNPESRIEEFSDLIYGIIKKNGKPHEVFTLGTSFALSNEIVSVDKDQRIITPWNFYEIEENKKSFFDSSYLDNFGTTWATKLPSDLSGKEFLEIIQILEFKVEELIKSSIYDLRDRSKLEWSKKIRSKIIGSYFVDSPNNDTFIDITKFTNWAISGGKKIRTLNRLQETIYESRPDLQSAYPIGASNFYQDFSSWLKNFGKNEISLENKYEFIINILEKTNILENRIRRNKLSNGFNIIGYQNYELGLGTAARQYRQILNNLEIETSDFHLDNALSKKIKSNIILTEVLPFDKNLVVIGADQIPEINTMVRNNWKCSRYTVGAIFWETDIIPLKIQNSLSIFDEFIASSNYIAKNLERYTDKKISVVGLPIESNDGIVTKIFNNDKITIYFNFDYLSDIYRKNVYSLVDYVKRKNKETKNKFNLILKSTNGKYFPLEKAFLNHLISGDDNIRELDTFLSKEDFQKLINEVDIYVSLHRSEGFGLGLAEAMSLGIPTMATAYSGNLDFMNPNNSYLIDFDLESISNSRRSPYSEFGGNWAQPRYESFSDQVDNLLSHPEERFIRITKAKNMINNEFSTLSISDKMKKALRSSGLI